MSGNRLLQATGVLAVSVLMSMTTPITAADGRAGLGKGIMINVSNGRGVVGWGGITHLGWRDNPSRAPAGAAGRRIPRSPGPSPLQTGRPPRRPIGDGDSLTVTDNRPAKIRPEDLLERAVRQGIGSDDDEHLAPASRVSYLVMGLDSLQDERALCWAREHLTD